jgi:hypothetical protein
MTDDACYMALGLNRGAPSEEIRKAYRNLSMKLHPDASGNPATAAGFSRMMRAYKVLTAQTSDTRIKSPMPDLPVLAADVKNDVFRLGTILVSDANPARRSEAAKQLGLSGKRAVWVFLRKGLYDNDERVVCSCIRAAAVLGLAQGGAEIAGAWARSSLPCQKAILRIAEATQSDLLVPVLEAAMQTEIPELRRVARRLLQEYRATYTV